MFILPDGRGNAIHWHSIHKNGYPEPPVQYCSLSVTIKRSWLTTCRPFDSQS